HRWGLIPVLKRNNDTMPVVIGLFAAFETKHAFFCFVLKRLRSACGSRVVSLCRFVDPSRGKVALPRLLELVPVVALERLGADPYLARYDVKALKHPSELVLADRLSGLAELGPGMPLHSGERLGQHLREHPVSPFTRALVERRLDVRKQRGVGGVAF